jgi:hypothetical protein
MSSGYELNDLFDADSEIAVDMSTDLSTHRQQHIPNAGDGAKPLG